MAFLWILFLLAIMSALSLAFLQKVSIGRSATASRGSAMQAHYLARSAANHALWRLLNDPGFAPSGTNYYMHDLGSGSYGYKVRKPTLTTFGTVATVGAVDDVVTKESYVHYLKPYDIISTYGLNGVGIIKNRRLIGASWSDGADTINMGPDATKWMVLKGCPIRKEMIMGTFDSGYDMNFAVWDGASWGNLYEFAVNTGIGVVRYFDIGYENQSGDALVIGRFQDNSLRYNIWNGSAWAFATAQQNAALSCSGTLSYLTMASKPNSDEILIAAAQWNGHLKVIRWNGSAFNDLGEVDNNLAKEENWSAAVVYEEQSGDALILWNHEDSSQVYYAVWDGAALSAIAQLPDFGQIPYMIHAAADPTSDYIFAAAVDKQNNLNVAVWDGDTWIDSRQLETANYANDQQIFDISWEFSGEEVIIAWAPGGGNKVHYFKWRKGTALADHSVEVGPDFQGSPNAVRLLPISGTQKIVLLGRNSSGHLRYSLWTGNTFLGDPAILLESDVLADNLPFGIAESGVTYTGGSG